MKILMDLISSTNKYLSPSLPQTQKSLSPVIEVATWITRIVNIFGLDSTTSPTIGWSEQSTDAEVGSEGVLPHLRVLSSFRDTVRIIASKNSLSELLSLSDRVRDDLAPLGVALDDREIGKPALIKFVPASELLAAREEKAEKARKKEEARIKKEEEDRKKAEAAKVSPTDMYKVGEEAGKWIEWDEDGVPTKDKDGVEVTKSRRKALAKGWERQKKAHEAWVKAAGGK